MKTNVNLTRKMGEFEVIQRTSDSMFNATLLAKQWNKKNKQRKDTADFLRLNSTKEYMEAIENETAKDNTGIPVFRNTRGKNGGTWMHPYLFIDFAMWLNPTFKVKVIKFVYDELIKQRHLAGDNYRTLCKALQKFGEVPYREVGKMLNLVIFNEHKSEKRNEATLEQQKELQQLERDMVKFIEMGFIKSYDQFKKVMRQEWRKRHGTVPVLLAS